LEINNSVKGTRISGESYYGAPKILAIWIHESNPGKVRLSIGGDGGRTGVSRTKNSQIIIDLDQLKSAIAELEK
jgi:hypothetical protein